MVLGLPHRQHRTVLVDRAKTGHRLRQVSRCQHATYTIDRRRSRRVDGTDPGTAAVEVDQLDVEHGFEPNVTDVLLLTGDTLIASQASLRHADHRSASLADRTASQICS